jgi:hypothetical protein
VLTGNAAAGAPWAAVDRGWFVGHFMRGDGGPRATTGVEVKWAVYQGGEARHRWSANRAGTTLAILVRGRFHLRFPERAVVLAREGDYALWQPGVPHHWRAEGPTIVVTVRWPSLPDDSVEVSAPIEQG